MSAGGRGDRPEDEDPAADAGQTPAPFLAADLSEEALSRLSPMGVVTDETLDLEDRMHLLARLRARIGPQRMDGTLDPGQADQRLFEIDAAARHLEGLRRAYFERKQAEGE